MERERAVRDDRAGRPPGHAGCTRAACGRRERVLRLWATPCAEARHLRRARGSFPGSRVSRGLRARFAQAHSRMAGGRAHTAMGRVGPCRSRVVPSQHVLPTPGVPRAEASLEEFADLLCKGPDAWDTEPPWAPPEPTAPASQRPGSAVQDSLFAVLPVQNDVPEWMEVLRSPGRARGDRARTPPVPADPLGNQRSGSPSTHHARFLGPRGRRGRHPDRVRRVPHRMA